jgi:hypothetical protein
MLKPGGTAVTIEQTSAAVTSLPVLTLLLRLLVQFL